MDELTYQEYMVSSNKIREAFNTIQTRYTNALLLQENGIVTKESQEAITTGNTLAWVLEQFEKKPKEPGLPL